MNDPANYIWAMSLIQAHSAAATPLSYEEALDVVIKLATVFGGHRPDEVDVADAVVFAQKLDGTFEDYE